MPPTCRRDNTDELIDTGCVPNLLLDPSKRSNLMASIRGKNTTPELIAFAGLNARRVRYQKHYENAPGKPDIAKPRKKLAVFIDGDFWHGRELDRVIAKYGETSSWVIKLQKNMQRDVDQERLLRSKGWDVLRVWESDLKRLRTRESTLDSIEVFLRSRDD
jgi:DNA mismatch endonuclease (patch repair protein)